MRYRVEITAQAKTEAVEAYQWLADRSPTRAARWYNGLLDAIRSLADHPRRCPFAPENDEFDEEIRQLLYGRPPGIYRILFEVHGSTVYVTHVRHGARQPLRAEPAPTDDDD